LAINAEKHYPNTVNGLGFDASCLFSAYKARHWSCR